MNKIIQWLKDNKVTTIECVTGDHTGILRGKIFPVDKFIQEQGFRIAEGILLQSASGTYVRDDFYYTLIDSRDIDMVLKPDNNACYLLPWTDEPTAMIIHDCFDQKGNVAELSPRNILKKVIKLYTDKNWQPVIAPEMELYLTAPYIDENQPLETPVGCSGRTESGRQSFGIDALNEFNPVIKDIYHWCSQQNVNIDIVVHEEGRAQFEFNFDHGDPIHLADQVTVFKRTVKAAAEKNDLLATFMAKPISGQPGSAMHIHQSIISADNGKNIFADESGNTKAFYHYIGGLQKYTSHVMPMYAPNVNSYRRFKLEQATPVNVLWAVENRTVGLRVPDSPAQARRVENRLPGADANPYLAIAATLLCGYIGMVEKTQASEETLERANVEANPDLPFNIELAILTMENSKQIRKYLGDNFVDAFIETRRSDHSSFKDFITAWERKYLLNAV